MNFLANIPNALSVIRFVMAPILIFVSHKGYSSLFLGLLAFSFATDVLDGAIARRFGLQTTLGAKLDSLADFAVYMVIPICAWLLWPEVIKQEKYFVIAVVLSIILPVLIGIFKFGNYPSYHTWLTKIAAAFMAIASIVLFLKGSADLFRVAAIICVCAALEEILITFLLSEPRSNVRSIFHILKQNNETDHEPDN